MTHSTARRRGFARSLCLATGLLAVPPSLAETQFSDGTAADLVLGQNGSFQTGLPILPPTQATLAAPAALAQEPSSGALWVADSANHRVLRFSGADSLPAVPGLVPVADLGLGSGAPGTSDSLLDSPLGVATEGGGAVWVADSGNNRVLRFSGGRAPAAQVIGQSGFNTDAAAAGTSGLSFPSGVAVDGLGNLWVADSSNNRVLRYSAASGAGSGPPADLVLGQTDFNAVGFGAGANQMNNPTALAFDSSGTLWVADSDNHRVLRFSGANSLLNGAPADAVLGQTSFGQNSPTQGSGGLNTPSGVSIDGAGTLWVADTGNSRVLGFCDARQASNGAAADRVLGQLDFSTAGPGTGNSGLAGPVDARVGGSGQLWVSDSSNHRVLRFPPAAAPEIAVQVMGGVELTDGVSSLSLDAPLNTASDPTVVTVSNVGDAPLSLAGVTLGGTDAGQFQRDLSGYASTLPAGAETQFSLTFHPTLGGDKTAQLSILSDDADEASFDLDLIGKVVSPSADTDGDGIGDAGEFALRRLGFDWQVAQPDLVAVLQNNASLAELYSLAQVQALNVGTPLLERETDGSFTLTIGVRQSSNLQSFTPLPMTAPATSLNGNGELEFNFHPGSGPEFYLLRVGNGIAAP